MITANVQGIIKPGDRLRSLMDARVVYEVVDCTSEHLIAKNADGETRLVNWAWLEEMLQTGRFAHEPTLPASNSMGQPSAWGTW